MSPLMEWSGRAPALPAVNAGRGTEDKEHAMSQMLNTSPAVTGIDIGKNSFHIVGQNWRGAIVLQTNWSRVKRWARTRRPAARFHCSHKLIRDCQTNKLCYMARSQKLEL